MNYVTHRISLDIHNTSSQVLLRVKGGETSRKLRITLRENGQPYQIADDCTAAFSAIKPDGNSLYNNCLIDGNTIVYTFTEQTTIAPGMMDCEIILSDGTGQSITSPRFSLLVGEGLFYGDEIISTPEATALDGLIERAKTAAENAEKVVDTLTDYSSDNFANALKGNISGSIVQADDVSPIEHNVRCRVRGKNLFNNIDDYKGYDYSYSTSDRALTVTGRYVHKFILLEEGKTYTFSCKSARTGTDGGGIYIRGYDETKTLYVDLSASVLINKLSPTVTVTMPKGYPYIRFAFYGYFAVDGSGTGVYTDIMLEEGTEATEFVPYIEDLSAVKVTRCGKNLFSSEDRTVSNFGAYNKETKRTVQEGCIYSGLSVNNYYSASYITSYDISNSRSITLSVSNDGGYGLGFSYKVKPDDTYTLSVADRPIDSSRLAFSFYAEDGTPISYVITAVGSTNNSVTATVPDTARWMIVLLISTKAETAVTFRDIQLEVGSDATEFESFNAFNTYSADPGGTVSGITSLFPSMTVFTDTANTFVSCDYNRDSNKMAKKLYDFIMQKLVNTKISSVTLRADSWIGDASPYSQVVDIPNITENSRVDLTPSAEQLAVFHNKDVAFVTENEDGVVTVYVIGQKPQNDYTIQISITEVL